MAPTVTTHVPAVTPGTGTMRRVVRIRLFASARDAAGTGHDELPGSTVGQVIEAARERYGDTFASLLPTCRIWVNGEPVTDDHPVGPGDELAVLPPVSGGAT
jgi:sulfur-carrier protein